MKKFLVTAAAAGLLMGGAGLAHATGPDATGPAKYGLCKAYFSGSQKGQSNKQGKKPFVALRTKAGDQDGDGDTDNDDVAAYCANTTPGGKGSSAQSTSSSSLSATRIAAL